MAYGEGGTNTPNCAICATSAATTFHRGKYICGTCYEANVPPWDRNESNSGPIASAQSHLAPARFRFVSVDGTEHSLQDSVALIEAVASGHLRADMMLFDAKVGRWQRAEISDAFMAATALSIDDRTVANPVLPRRPESADSGKLVQQQKKPAGSVKVAQAHKRGQSNGWPLAALATVVVLVGLGVAFTYASARLQGHSADYFAGFLLGQLTVMAVIGFLGQRFLFRRKRWLSWVIVSGLFAIITFREHGRQQDLLTSGSNPFLSILDTPSHAREYSIAEIEASGASEAAKGKMVSLQVNLINLITAQEAYFARHGAYASQLSALIGEARVHADPNDNIDFVGYADGYRIATSTNPLPGILFTACIVEAGPEAPREHDGKIRCH